MNKKQKKNLIRIIVSAVLLIILAILKPQGIWGVLYFIPYGIIGYDTLLKAAKGIRNHQVLDEHFLMAVATIGAFVLAFAKTGDFVEAVAVMLFYQIGELFESVAVGKSRRSISELMDIRPDEAFIEQNGEYVSVDPDEVEVGTEIVIRPGEKVPIDGIVVSGHSTLDTAALTGESVPRDVKENDTVLSGAINLSGLIRVKTTHEFGESTASKILDLVENASSNKSKSEDFIAKFARVYTPAVCIAALVLASLPPIVLFLMGKPVEIGDWLYRALTFLVISCPCALVISIPLTFFAGLGGASRAGVLIKGSNYVEALSKAGIVVMDKTGTLTHGVFDVIGVHHPTVPETELLQLTALAESGSNHPISVSIRNAAGDLDLSRVSEIEEISGHGVLATVDGRKIAAGNEKLMARIGIDAPKCSSVGTIVHTAIDAQYTGHIVISDKIKETAASAVGALHDLGVRRIVMLSGDTTETVRKIGRELGIEEQYGELLPQDKVNKVEQLLGEKKTGETLLFVGDGINDAPVISRADVGIAMGAIGSDAAIEAADVVLMDDNPMKIATAIAIARKCMRIVYENIGFAIGIKMICLVLGALGLANMWLAVFADVGVMILAVLNAIRALFVPKNDKGPAQSSTGDK